VHVPPLGPVKPLSQVQAVLLMLPTAGECEFAEQVSHAAEPVTSLNSPASHCVHVPPLGPVKPTSHAQAVLLMLPAGESELAGQASHAAEPVTSLNLPASHCVHVPPSGPSKPASHTHSVLSSVCGLESAGQEKGSKHMCNKASDPEVNCLDTPWYDLDSPTMQWFIPAHM